MADVTPCHLAGAYEVRLRELEADTRDHELRIRAIERWSWKLAGLSMAGAALGGAIPLAVSLLRSVGTP